MHVRLYVMFFSVISLIASSVCAQSTMPPEFTEDNSPTVPVEIDLNDKIEEFLTSKGWNEGSFTTKSGKKAFAAIGKGTISANRSAKSFIASREIAFQKAVLAAKKGLVEYLGTEISTSLTSEYLEPSEKRQQATFDEAKRQGVALQSSAIVASAAGKDVALLAKDEGYWGSNTVNVASDQGEVLMKNELDKQLKEMGLDPNKPIDQQTLNSITSQESFQRVINAVAKSRISGVQVYKTWEYLPEGEKGSIAVLLIQSARLVKLADSLFSGNAALAPGTVNGKALRSQIPQDKKVLIGTFGVQFKKNERNKWCLVSYGQAQPRNKNPRALIAAQDKGALNAKGMIRQFAGEIAISSTNKQDSESAADLADETEKYNYDEHYAEKMQTHAGKLNIAGMSVIKRWKSKHPLTGALVAGSVVSWCPGAMQNALSLKKQMKAPPKATNLGAINSQQNGRQSQVPAIQTNQGQYFGASAEADDDF